MRFTDIRHDDLPTGRLTIWVPSEVTRATAGATERDDRRTSHNQEGHLTRALARRLDPGLQEEVVDPTGAGDKAAPTGWLAVRFDVAPSNIHTLRRAFEAWIARHETLRSGFRAEGPTTDEVLIERYTIAAEAVTLEPRDLGHHPDPKALGEYLDNLFNASTDAVSWPAYVFAAIAGATTTSVILAFNHLNVDGYSMLLMAKEVRELVDADREGRPASLPLVPSYIDFVEAERAAADRADVSHPAVEQWREFLGADHDVPRFPLPDGLAPGSQIPQSSCCLPILTEEEASAFGRWCRDRGISAGAGFLGAYTLACTSRARLGRDATDATDDRFRVLVSTHTRNEPHWALALGWFTAVAPFGVTLPADAGLEAALPAIDAAWSRAKVGASLPLARIAELIERPIDPRFVVSYLDARHTPGGVAWQAWRAHAYLGDVGPTDEVYAWINRMPTETYLTWRFPDNETCRNEVGAVTELMQHIIFEALADERPSPATREVPAPW